MKHPILLKRFEYSIPTAPSTVKGSNSRDRHSFDMHLPQVNVDINFEANTLFLEGNGRLISPTATQHQTLKRSARDMGRIKVNAAICPGTSNNQPDFVSDGQVFSLTGTINDGESISSCSGLLMLERKIGTGGTGGKEWNLTLYLYDDYDDEREIKLELPMYSISETAQLN